MRAYGLGIMMLAGTLAAAARAEPARSPSPQPRAEPHMAERWPAPPGPVRDGRVAMPLADNLHLGIGRFPGAEVRRSRTHTEPFWQSGDMGRRGGGRAAVGLSLRF